ncbi:WD domain-containing protein [Colletotrichum graminicola M1.001]|uniref:WD domain-containing protein n=1 Tax=Colletotrichum graminicola (strain M1.001 / M2 / FGSC 10212) TaxID=645133 RepID=E3QQ49_COLGM|nr:WD domain-containing protein [Colletotrichum graminicola M1.001]EFQ32987.1 WD domain-containing protein [Colletotrichum graminicola M1.001]
MHRYIPHRDAETPLSDKIRLKALPPPPSLLPSSRAIVTVGRPSILSTNTPEPPVKIKASGRRITTRFFGPRPREEEDQKRHEERLADALKIDQAARVLRIGLLQPSSTSSRSWPTLEAQTPPGCNLPSGPYRVLQAPELEDDYYRSPLAYSPTCGCLAVALGNTVYRWSEQHDPQPVYRAPRLRRNSLTSLSFSSTQGGKAILAFGRKDGFFVMKRPSQNPFNSGALVPTEDILVGDGQGGILHYMVEWPSLWEISRDTWFGKVTPIAKIAVHTSQICALVWSPNGQQFVSGSNDNTACYFEMSRTMEGPHKKRDSAVVRRSRRSMEHDGSFERGTLPADQSGVGPSQRESVETSLNAFPNSETIEVGVAENITRATQTSMQGLRLFGHGTEIHCWRHDAAIKAIAFCPWQEGLVATGGGLGDKCIHFFHAGTSTPLATIVVGAQVTSLIWSTTKREIAATFGYSHGYAQTEHPYRIVVFSWPSCRQISAVAWPGGPRALYAIPYPRGPADARKGSRTAREGTIVVASSDETLKFHEVWWDQPKMAIGGAQGILGSDILESLAGIDKEGDVIR